jgi:hypothetical protein
MHEVQHENDSHPLQDHAGIERTQASRMADQMSESEMNRYCGAVFAFALFGLFSLIAVMMVMA